METTTNEGGDFEGGAIPYNVPVPIVRPRLTDYHGILLSQAQPDFAIPFLDEDIPLYLDPFLLWRSPSQQDNALHTAIVNSFNHLGYLEKQGKHAEAVEIFTTLPTNSDVVVILSQYAGAVLRFRTENTDQDHGQSWIINGKASTLHAGYPSNFKYHPK